MACKPDYKMRACVPSCYADAKAEPETRSRPKYMSRYLGLAAALAFMHAPVASADTFKCMDANGRATYTNMKEETRGKNCTLVVREISVVPSVQLPKAKATPSPAGFPKVDPATQKTRDDSRRRILEDELSAEEKALTKAKAELAEQESIRTGNEKNYQRVLDRLQPYKDDVARHEKNIEALKKELGNTK
jgi:hypothetical protein